MFLATVRLSLPQALSQGPTRLISKELWVSPTVKEEILLQCPKFFPSTVSLGLCSQQPPIAIIEQPGPLNHRMDTSLTRRLVTQRETKSSSGVHK